MILIQILILTVLSESVYCKYFTQILDHFDKNNNNTWSQRYFVNDDYFNGTNSPIFLLVGGEGRIGKSAIKHWAWNSWMNQFGALAFELEHRFYGYSQPTNDVSTESLKYLSSEQALQDIANFINQMNTNYNLTSANKWILFGGSYPGTLVVWARYKFPNLVYGSIASSAPIGLTYKFPQYHEITATSLSTYSPECVKEIHKGFRKIQKYSQSDDGIQKINNTFSLCNVYSANSGKDMSSFILSLVGTFTTGVQYNGTENNFNISNICSIMLDKSTSDPMKRVFNVYQSNNVMNKQYYSCIASSYQAAIDYYSNTSWQADVNTDGTRQWQYQLCNEFGQFQISEDKNGIFSDTLPLSYFLDTCKDVFGSSFSSKKLQKKINYHNKVYGGTNIVVTRVVFLQGTTDPFHALGMVQNPTPDDPLVIIQGGSHTQDMSHPTSEDSASLKHARKVIDEYLNSWINENCDNPNSSSCSSSSSSEEN